MFDKILELLKTKFEGVQEDILRRIAENKAKTATEENIDKLVEGVSFQDVLNSYGDSRATEAAKTAVANYQKKQQTQQTQQPPQETKTEEKNQQSEVPAWAKALTDELTSIKSELGNFKAQNTTQLRREAFLKEIKDVPESAKNILLKSFDVASSAMQDETAYNNFVESIKPDIQSAVALGNQMKLGSVPKPPIASGANGEPTKEELDKVIEKLSI